MHFDRGRGPKVAIIPQTPELLSGTPRQNLDPFAPFDDAAMNDALRASGLYFVQAEAGEGRITLDTVIAGGGSHLSTVGQPQIHALAKTTLRESKLLILEQGVLRTSRARFSARNLVHSHTTSYLHFSLSKTDAIMTYAGYFEGSVKGFTSLWTWTRSWFWMRVEWFASMGSSYCFSWAYKSRLQFEFDTPPNLLQDPSTSTKPC